MAISEQSNNATVAAVGGENVAGGDGVFGKGNRGVVGVSDAFQGVFGLSSDNAGVVGESTNFDGVFGVSHKTTAAGVSGHNETGGFGVFGESKNGGRGVAGFSDTFQGVYGHSDANAGVVGESEQFDGLFGVSHRSDRAGVSGRSINQDGTVNHEGLAGFFDGKVVVTNDIILSNADCAEDFDVTPSETVEPGTVMVLGEEGILHPNQQAYDKRVAGVVSGAGNYKPGLVLDKQQTQPGRQPIALLGKVYCRVDADYAPIDVGDLLTTAPTPGHAMKATDAMKAFGAVLGKALRPLKAGQGLIPILIALQ